jgi:hypothetical protein
MESAPLPHQQKYGFTVIMDSYTYFPLRSHRHIRLLKLQRGHGDKPVLCSLTQVSLDENPVYEALSYTWELEDDLSDNRVHHTILCEGQTLSAAPNLFAALKRLRGVAEERRTLWIDALCINQRDNAERSQQVQIMDVVYSKAERVVVWLGEEQPSDSAAVAALKQLSQYIVSKGEDFDIKVATQDVWNAEGALMQGLALEGWEAIGSMFCKRSSWRDVYNFSADLRQWNGRVLKKLCVFSTCPASVECLSFSRGFLD